MKYFLMLFLTLTVVDSFAATVVHTSPVSVSLPAISSPQPVLPVIHSHPVEPDFVMPVFHDNCKHVKVLDPVTGHRYIRHTCPKKTYPSK